MGSSSPSFATVLQSAEAALLALVGYLGFGPLLVQQGVLWCAQQGGVTLTAYAAKAIVTIAVVGMMGAVRKPVVLILGSLSLLNYLST